MSKLFDLIKDVEILQNVKILGVNNCSMYSSYINKVTGSRTQIALLIYTKNSQHWQIVIYLEDASINSHYRGLIQ